MMPLFLTSSQESLIPGKGGVTSIALLEILFVIEGVLSI